MIDTEQDTVGQMNIPSDKENLQIRWFSVAWEDSDCIIYNFTTSATLLLWDDFWSIIIYLIFTNNNKSLRNDHSKDIPACAKGYNCLLW